MATPLTSPPDIEYLGGTVAREQVGLGRDALRRLRRNKLALVAGVYLVLLAVVCVISLFWTPYKPNAIGTCQTYELPSASHPLGCDDLGRDSLSRLMVGSQISLAVGLATAFIVLVVGVVVGLVAGFFRGVIDAVVSLIINVFYGIPTFLVALALYVLLGPGLINIIAAISTPVWMDMARLKRDQAMGIPGLVVVAAPRRGGPVTGCQDV